LNNTVKHAQATAVNVTVSVEGTDITLCVQDNGIGFEVDSTSGGLGLPGMRERTTQLNGTLEFDSNPGEGTRVTLKVPLND
jgi:signal transduction histidine kinase